VTSRHHETLLGYYSARACEYDKVYLKPERQDDLRGIAQWLPTVFAGAAVMEIACGTGYWTQFLARTASHVLALDAAPETLAVAKARVPGGKVSFRVGDAYALPQTDRQFGGGFAGFWISHVPKSRVREFVVGLHAALQPGATVVFLDNLFVEGSSSPIRDQDEEGNTYQTRSLRDGTTHRVLKNFPSEDEMRRLLDGLCARFQYKCWRHYWAVEYVAAGL
jgi:demethylmenaquinone methyltransferase/2-methoxy-6-polyprenyl-1,4-benzoquinol methylase